MPEFFSTLYGRLSLILVGAFCVVGMALWLMMEYSTTKLQEETAQKLHLELAQHIVEDVPIWQGGELDQGAIKQAFHMMMVLGPSIELYVIDRDGKILGYDAPEEKIKRRFVDLAPVHRFIRGDTNLPILGDDPRGIDSSKIFSAAPVYSGDDHMGYLYIIIGGEQYDRVSSVLETNHVYRSLAVFVLASLAFMCVVALLLFYLIARPVQGLASRMTKFTEGEFVAVETTGKKSSIREIQQLEKSFVSMAETIQEQIKSLKETDSLRQELISQVSHDLRTPLTGLKGYLETIAFDEKIQLEEKTRSYLELAIKNTDKLGNLIRDLLEMARLNSSRIELRLDDFRLDELVSDMMLQFNDEILQNQQRISVDVRQPTEVRGDIARIQRVVGNLLENAVRYSGKGSAIDISIGPVPGKDGLVQFCIRDSGPGIKASEMGEVFKPYHRGERGHQSSEGHGLGLTISRRIIELHGSRLELEATEGEGSRFSFCLPAPGI